MTVGITGGGNSGWDGPRLVAGRKYAAMNFVSASVVYGNVAMLLANRFFMPYWSGVQGLTIDQLSVVVNVVGGAGSVVSLAVYDGNLATMYPGALRFASGNLDTTILGERTAAVAPAISIPARGLYFVAIQAAVAAPTLKAASSLIDILGSRPTGAQEATVDWGYLLNGGGAFPDPAPAGMPLANAAATQVPPLVLVRAASVP